MIIWILLIALVVTAGVLVAGGVQDLLKTKAYRKGLGICAIVCVALVTLCLIISGSYDSQISKLQAKYNDIMLYNEIVEVCDNEQVRFGHYERIEAFNEAYDHLVELKEDFMFGALIPKDWSANMDKIDFYFRGVNYEYEG